VRNRWLLRPSELGRYHPKLVIGKAMVWGSHISGSPHIIGQHHFRWFPCASNCVSLWCLSGLVEHPTGPGVGFHGDLRQLWSEAAKPGAGLRLSNDSFMVLWSNRLIHLLHLPNGYGSIPINTICRGMNIHLPAILMFTRGTRF